MKAESTPRITVVIAVRNAVSTVQRCLDSVVQQSYRAWELIVVDGASTDGTREVVVANAAHLAHWESEPDRGIAHAWNKALTKVTGDFVLFLGADDTLHGDDALAGMAPSLAACPPDVSVVYGKVDVVSPDGSVTRRAGRPWPEVRSDFRLGMTIPHQATFHRRELFSEVGSYDESYAISADYELLLRKLLVSDAIFVDEIVADMGAGGISDRPEGRVTIARETHRARTAKGLTRTPEWRAGPVVRARILARVTAHAGETAADSLRKVYRNVRRRIES